MSQVQSEAGARISELRPARAEHGDADQGAFAKRHIVALDAEAHVEPDPAPEPGSPDHGQGAPIPPVLRVVIRGTLRSEPPEQEGVLAIPTRRELDVRKIPVALEAGAIQLPAAKRPAGLDKQRVEAIEPQRASESAPFAETAEGGREPPRREVPVHLADPARAGRPDGDVEERRDPLTYQAEGKQHDLEGKLDHVDGVRGRLGGRAGEARAELVGGIGRYGALGEGRLDARRGRLLSDRRRSRQSRGMRQSQRGQRGSQPTPPAVAAAIVLRGRWGQLSSGTRVRASAEAART